MCQRREMALVVPDPQVDAWQTSRGSLCGRKGRVLVVVAVPPRDRRWDTHRVEVPRTVQGHRFVSPALGALPKRLRTVSPTHPLPGRVAHDGAILGRCVGEDAGHAFIAENAHANLSQQLMERIPPALGGRLAGGVYSH